MRSLVSSQIVNMSCLLEKRFIQSISGAQENSPIRAKPDEQPARALTSTHTYLLVDLSFKSAELSTKIQHRETYLQKIEVIIL